jgi:anti-anti-sigma regulatory factor
MSHHSSQLPQDVYHRLYWYVKRNVAPHRIAAALNLPLKTVFNLVYRLKADSFPEHDALSRPPDAIQVSTADTSGDFLDIFLFSKTRYSVIDISGSLCGAHAEKLATEVDSLTQADRKPLALKMTDIVAMDEPGANAIIALHKKFSSNGRYFAILDPSAVIDPLFKQYHIDEKIPVFGTELAFEQHAF